MLSAIVETRVKTLRDALHPAKRLHPGPWGGFIRRVSLLFLACPLQVRSSFSISKDRNWKNYTLWSSV